jgi:hypothetical protein
LQVLRRNRPAGLVAHWSGKQPYAIISVPIPPRATTPGKPPAQGVAVAAFELSYVRNFINAGIPTDTMSTSILDALRRVVANVGDRAVGSVFPPAAAKGA